MSKTRVKCTVNKGKLTALVDFTRRAALAVDAADTACFVRFAATATFAAACAASRASRFIRASRLDAAADA